MDIAVDVPIILRMREYLWLHIKGILGGAAVVHEGGVVERRRDREGVADCDVPAEGEVCEQLQPSERHRTE